MLGAEQQLSHNAELADYSLHGSAICNLAVRSKYDNVYHSSEASFRTAKFGSSLPNTMTATTSSPAYFTYATVTGTNVAETLDIQVLTHSF